MFKVSIKRATAVVAAVAIGAVGLAAVNASAGPVKKTYVPSVSPALKAGTTPTIDFKLANTTSGPVDFGSAEIVVDSRLVFAGGSTTTISLTGAVKTTAGATLSQPSTARATWVASTRTIAIRDIDVPTGAAVTVSLPFNVPCGGTNFTVNTVVRQSNDFLGNNNEFTATTPNLTLPSTGACKLAITSQPPANNEVNTAIPITLTAQDGNDGTITSFTGAVAVRFVGTTTPVFTMNAVAGVAAFSSSTTSIITSAMGTFRLEAISPDFTTATPAFAKVTSDQFTVATICAQDAKTCETPVITGPNSTAQVLVNDGGSTGPSQVKGNIIANYSGSSISCAAVGYPDAALADQFSFTFDDQGSPANAQFLSKTVTYKATAPAGRTAASYQVCFQAPYDFPALNNTGTNLLEDIASNNFLLNTIVAGTGSSTTYTGILLPCSYATPTIKTANGLDTVQTPCVSFREIVGTQIVLKVDVPLADPAFRAG